jgi:peptide deformylase
MASEHVVVAILEILEAPHPILEAKARPVAEDEFGPELEAKLRNMAETMYAAPGVGLAAPQVGDGRRMLVADLSKDDNADTERTGENLILMVNPEIVEREGRILWEESCLSVPEFSIDVERARRIKVAYRDPMGARLERWFEEFPAVVIQHEMDHLEGVTLLDRASRLKRSRYVKQRRKRSRVTEEEFAV